MPSSVAVQEIGTGKQPAVCTGHAFLPLQIARLRAAREPLPGLHFKRVSGIRETFAQAQVPEGPVPRATCSNLLAICPKSGVPAQLETLKNDAPRFLSRKTAHKQ
jgi:hypothetical protein